MMSSHAQELLGKVLLALTFGLLLLLQSVGLGAALNSDVRPATWALDLLSQILSLSFVAFAVVMTIRRMPPHSTAAGLSPRVAAVAGTFALMALVFLPPGQTSLPIEMFATWLIVVGTAGSIWCLRYLGRSFSIVASARQLVTGGPYGIVRHPLYLAEGITTLGIVLMHWSAAAVAIGIIQIALQFWRMQFEEDVLRKAFPEYEDYAEQVGMIIPGVR